VRPHRSLRALLVDVPPAHANVLVGALEENGWRVQYEHADEHEALSAALARRGWDAVLYGGDGAHTVPARKALALVRLADPHLPFLAVSPFVRAGDLSSVIRGLDGATVVVSDPSQLPRALGRQLDATRLRRRVGSAHHLLLAQQAITDHLAAGLDPDELCKRVLATLGDTLGWTYGAAWRPDEVGQLLRCTGTWHAPNARPEVIAYADGAHGLTFAPGQGLPGRVWAFRRPAWVADVGSDARMVRSRQATRAGLMSAVAFPIALADECSGVLEFFSGGIQEPNAEISAMFATVGGQLAQYIERRRLEAAESRRLHAALRAESERARGFLDAAWAMIVVLDADGCVQMANARACAALGLDEPAILGRDWFDTAVPKPNRTAARDGYERLLTGEEVTLRHRLPSAGGERRSVAWQSIPLDHDGGIMLLGQAETVARPSSVAVA
jgi:PAS domain S-box-containing protein